MAQTNDEINYWTSEHLDSYLQMNGVSTKTRASIPLQKLSDLIKESNNTSRLAERISLVYEIESGCLSYIPRKMKTKREEEISSEGYVHGVKSALEVIKNSNPADIFDWNKIIKDERLAALDDCKTLLERVLLENKKKMLHASEELHKAYAIGSQFNLFALDTEDKQRKASKRLSDMEKHIANARNTIDLSEIIITKNGTEFKALAELEALRKKVE